MEELGFHVGIVPEQMRQSPDRVSNEEKEDLLRTLGLLEQKAKDAHLLSDEDLSERKQTASDRDEEIDLDAILANLDKALDSKFEPENETISYREHTADPATADAEANTKTERVSDKTATIRCGGDNSKNERAKETIADENENEIDTEILDNKEAKTDEGIDGGIAAVIAAQAEDKATTSDNADVETAIEETAATAEHEPVEAEEANEEAPDPVTAEEAENEAANDPCKSPCRPRKASPAG